MAARRDILPRPEPHGLRREMAAAYVGLSASVFDRAVRDGDMPAPAEIAGIKVWSRRKLEEALDGGPPPTNPWDDEN